MRTTMDYNLKIAQHGDNACRATNATVELYNPSNVMTFYTPLSEDDVTQALTEEGFDLAIQIEAAEADTAFVTL